MKRHAPLPPLALFGLALVAACSDRAPLAPTSDAGIAADRAITAGTTVGAPRISALSRNIYIGANVDAVIQALASPDPTDDLPALNAAVMTLQQTAFPARAEALADEIATHRPHVVGLQEVEQLAIDLRALGLPVKIDLDFLAILQAALAARGLNYAVAAKVRAVEAAPIPGITVLDHEVLLVDAARVTVGPAKIERTFTANLGVVAPGVNLKRGWVQINVTIDGMPMTVASTHLEAGDLPGLELLRAAQATELMAFLGAASPAILLGDLNDDEGSPMYQVVTGAGFVDAWRALRPGARGLTCCHVADLSNTVAGKEFDQRIDYVLARGLAHPSGSLHGQVSIVGSTPGDRVAGPFYPLWPSDHAGVVARLLLPPAAVP
ncbi:MAG: endonuclease/exonuclease/phosphatase family protein [Gemmatimonadales bacterium]